MTVVYLLSSRHAANPNVVTATYWCANLLKKMGFEVKPDMDAATLVPRGIPGGPRLGEALDAVAPGDALGALGGDPITVHLDTEPQGGERSLQGWPNGWSIAINDVVPASETVVNPIAAAICGTALAASCHALVDGRVPPSFSYDFLAHARRFAPGEQLPDMVTIPPIALGGVGAIGTSFCMALAASGARGRMKLMDPKNFRSSNLNRYVFGIRGCAEGNKAEAVAKFLRGWGLEAEAYPRSAVEITEDLDPGWLVVTAMDGPEGRRAVARNLPLRALDAANGHDEPRIEIASLSFPPEGPCLCCIYPPDVMEDVTKTEVIRELGLTSDEYGAFMGQGEPLTEEWIKEIEYRTGYCFPPEAVGEGLETAYSRHYCGGPSRDPGEAPGRDIDGPTKCPVARTYSPGMAGLLLACEVIKQGLGHPTVENWFDWDLRHAPNPSRVRRKFADPECPVCSDSAYREVYAERARAASTMRMPTPA